MALADRRIRRGDSFPPHVRVLTDEDGLPLDLPAGAVVRFLARKDATTAIIDTVSVVTVQDALDTGWLSATPNELAAWAPYLGRRAGVVWDIDPADTAVGGAYPYEYEITYNPLAPANQQDIETVPQVKADSPVLTIDEDNG